MDVRWLPVVIVIGMLYMDCVSVIAVVVVRCDFELRAYTVRREETQKMTRWNNKSGYFKVWFPVRLYKREDDATTTKTGFVVQFGVLRSQVALISDNLYIISIYIYTHESTRIMFASTVARHTTTRPIYMMHRLGCRPTLLQPLSPSPLRPSNDSCCVTLIPCRTMAFQKAFVRCCCCCTHLCTTKNNFYYYVAWWVNC